MNTDDHAASMNLHKSFLDHHQLNVGRVDAMPTQGQVSYCTAGGCWKVPWRCRVVKAVGDLMHWQILNNRGSVGYDKSRA